MPDFSTIPTDQELQLRIRNFEDHFVERKSLGDSKDWLKTAVAFANSAPIGFPCVLYLGVKNDGTPERGAADSNLEKLQSTFAEKIKAAYPRIPYYPRIFRIGNQQLLAIIIPGSDLRPHFSQRPHVRVGERTLEATDAQFEELIAQRNIKAAYLLAHKHEKFTVVFLKSQEHWVLSGRVQAEWPSCELVECNQFFVSFRGENTAAVPLERIQISREVKSGQLKLEIFQ